MMASLNPLREARRSFGEGVWSGDADGIESERLRPREKRVFQPLRGRTGPFRRSLPGQKSGSA
jgi:hypothetical protein